MQLSEHLVAFLVGTTMGIWRAQSDTQNYKADFECHSLEAQGMLLDMLCTSVCMTPEWWKSTLFGEMLDSVEEIDHTTSK